MEAVCPRAPGLAVARRRPPSGAQRAARPRARRVAEPARRATRARSAATPSAAVAAGCARRASHVRERAFGARPRCGPWTRRRRAAPRRRARPWSPRRGPKLALGLRCTRAGALDRCARAFTRSWKYASVYAFCGFVGDGGATAGSSSSSAVQSLSRFQCGQLVRFRASSSVMRPVDAPGSSIRLGRRACAVVASVRRPIRMVLGVSVRHDAGWGVGCVLTV